MSLKFSDIEVVLGSAKGKIFDKTDLPVRDIAIQFMWEGLRYSDLKYKERIEILASTFLKSEKLIEHIINNLP